MAEDQDKGQEEATLQTENGLIDGGFLTLEKAMGVMEDLVIWCCKTMEHIIYHSIIPHLNSFNVLIENQHRFRSQHSCVTQLISLLEDLSYSMDHHQQTDVLLLDFAKAFDSVPHQRLLVKLRHYGITNNICHWISTWLTLRSQQVVLDGASSESVSVQSGVEEDAVQLQNDLNHLFSWAIKWQLHFNVTKCTIIHFTRSLSPILFNYKLNDCNLTTSGQHSYLGIINYLGHLT